MPLLPVGNICIRRFARTFDGVTEGGDAVSYKCRTVATERMTTSVTFRITAAADCDDVGPLVPVTGLRAKGTTIRRGDGFAHFAGRAQIINAGPDPDVVLLRMLDLIARIGSHVGLGEPCGPEKHVEGWFTGRGKGDYAKMALHLILAVAESWRQARTRSPTSPRTASSARSSLCRKQSVLVKHQRHCQVDEVSAWLPSRLNTRACSASARHRIPLPECFRFAAGGGEPTVADVGRPGRDSAPGRARRRSVAVGRPT